CHLTSNYSDTSPECVTCHQTDYDTTTNPDHGNVGYPTDCVECHSTNPGWTPATVNHDFFPLTLGHDISDCTQCHTNGNYSNLSPECVTCHQSDYDTTNDPNHDNAQFPTDCVECHTTNPNWTPVNWDHNEFYPLNGAHAIIANECVECHNGDYTNTPNTCVGCHLDDYNSTTDPNHSSAQFPQDCTECHTEITWDPSTFDHDGMYFPIYSGKHNGEWSQCIDCHTNPNDYGIFTCFTCHSQSDMFDVHNHPGDSEFDGYVYESNACLECHPDGSD
ncbi:MAG: cytochrome c3 family protein, partial [Flavobacteriaceae bacterium]